MDSKQHLVNEFEAAKYLGLSPRTLRKARCTGALPNGIPELPFYKIGKATDNLNALMIPGAIVAILFMLLGALLAIYAMLDAPFATALKVARLPLLAAIGVLAVLGAGGGLLANHQRLHVLNVNKCRGNLGNNIRMAISSYETERHRPPPSLKALVEAGKLAATSLRCPGVKHTEKDPADRADYLYQPVDAAPTFQPIIRACDRFGNHGEDGCNVLFSNGACEWRPEAEFQVLLQSDKNKRIAEQDAH